MADVRSSIDSITVSPDPPKPGQDLTVNVEAYANEIIEVCRAPFYPFLLVASWCLQVLAV